MSRCRQYDKKGYSEKTAKQYGAAKEARKE
jgi:hypothetical protein